MTTRTRSQWLSETLSRRRSLLAATMSEAVVRPATVGEGVYACAKDGEDD